jgi:hypothetical protein
VKMLMVEKDQPLTDPLLAERALDGYCLKECKVGRNIS